MTSVTIAKSGCRVSSVEFHASAHVPHLATGSADRTALYFMLQMKKTILKNDANKKTTTPASSARKSIVLHFLLKEVPNETIMGTQAGRQVRLLSHPPGSCSAAVRTPCDECQGTATLFEASCRSNEGKRSIASPSRGTTRRGVHALALLMPPHMSPRIL